MILYHVHNNELILFPATSPITYQPQIADKIQISFPPYWKLRKYISGKNKLPILQPCIERISFFFSKFEI